jgi:hypothetical protein
MGEMRNAYKILVGKSEGKRPLRRPRHRLEDNIKVEWEGVAVHTLPLNFIWLRIGTGGRLL